MIRSPEEQAIHEEVRLTPHDPRWPSLFEAERDRLAGLLPELCPIEHIGSTAVAGLQAKPIIDLLAGVESMARADALFEPILGCGYTTSREFNAALSDRRWFMRSAGGHRTHHLHVVVYQGSAWQEHLRFRHLLRDSPRLAQSYAQLKTELAACFRDDREAYTDAKAQFIAHALAVA